MEQPKILTKEEYHNKKKVLQPIYGLTAGLTNHAVTKAVMQVLKDSELGEEYLPLEISKKYQLKEMKSAIKGIHFPKKEQEMLEAMCMKLKHLELLILMATFLIQIKVELQLSIQLVRVPFILELVKI